MLPQLQAEHQLAAIEAASVPYMSASAQKDVFSRLKSTLAVVRVPARRASEADLAAIGIQVEYSKG